LRRVVRSSDGSHITLRASNAKFADSTYPSSQVSVVGVFRGLIRQSGK